MPVQELWGSHILIHKHAQRHSNKHTHTQNTLILCLGQWIIRHPQNNRKAALSRWESSSSELTWPQEKRLAELFTTIYTHTYLHKSTCMHAHAHTHTQMPGRGDDGSRKNSVWLMIPQPGWWLLSGKEGFMSGSDQHSTFPNKPHPNAWLHSAANVHCTSLVISHSVRKAYICYTARNSNNKKFKSTLEKCLLPRRRKHSTFTDF